MFLQHDDPHRHMAPGIETVYLFLILAPILVALMVFLLWKVLSHLEKRKAADPSKIGPIWKALMRKMFETFR